jgi:hypothetical protein
MALAAGSPQPVSEGVPTALPPRAAQLSTIRVERDVASRPARTVTVRVAAS